MIGESSKPKLYEPPQTINSWTDQSRPKATTTNFHSSCAVEVKLTSDTVQLKQMGVNIYIIVKLAASIYASIYKIFCGSPVKLTDGRRPKQ